MTEKVIEKVTSELTFEILKLMGPYLLALTMLAFALGYCAGNIRQINRILKLAK